MVAAENNYRSAVPHHAKTSECQRAGHKRRGGGGPPPATLCVQAFSRESLDPPPGTGRGTTSRVLTCDGPNPANLPGAARWYVPFGWAARKTPLGRSAPGGPPARRGSPFLPRNGEKEGRGFAPGPRGLRALVATRWFLGSLSLIRSRGYSLRDPKTDLGRIFEKNMLKSIFRKESFQIRARRWVTK